MKTLTGATLGRALMEHVFFPYRYAALTERLAPYLAGLDTVLDVGASCGRLGRSLADAIGCAFSGVDVFLQPHSYIEVRLYDGHALPFDDDTFDCVLLADVLHHCTDPEQTVREARRVARQFVLIKDHYWDTRLDVLALRVFDYLGNAPYGIALPYHYYRLEEWAGLFERHRLTPAALDTWRYASLDPCKHIVAKLQVAAPQAAQARV